jgi:hypothetical protein
LHCYNMSANDFPTYHSFFIHGRSIQRMRSKFLGQVLSMQSGRVSIPRNFWHVSAMRNSFVAEGDFCSPRANGIRPAILVVNCQNHVCAQNLPLTVFKHHFVSNWRNSTGAPFSTIKATVTPGEGELGAISISFPAISAERSSTSKATCGTVRTSSGTGASGSNPIHSIP